MSEEMEQQKPKQFGKDGMLFSSMDGRPKWMWPVIVMAFNPCATGVVAAILAQFLPTDWRIAAFVVIGFFATQGDIAFRRAFAEAVNAGLKYEFLKREVAGGIRDGLKAAMEAMQERQMGARKPKQDEGLVS